MNKETRLRLEQACELIEDSLLKIKYTDSKIISTWLRVAADYCLEAAEEIGKGK